MKQMLSLVLAALLLLGPAVATAETAEDPDNIALVATGPDAVAKGYYDLQAKPGEVRTLTFAVSNPTKHAIEGEVFATDAATADNGGMRAREPEEKNVDAGGWLTGPSPITQRLAAGEKRSLTFTLRVPKDAKPGQHVASVIARVYTEGANPERPTGDRSNFKVNMLHQVIIGVLVTVPGPTVHRLKATGAELYMQGDQPWVRVSLRNEGNVIEKPRVIVQVLDATQKELSSQVRPMDSVYPGTEGAALVQATDLAGAGRYPVKVTLDYGTNQTATGTYSIDLTQAQRQEAAEVKAGRVTGGQLPAGAVVLTTQTLVAIVGGLLALILVGGGLVLWRVRRR